ncbi:hypothetical protein FS837_012517 [Tulasnella sp. UAMH 9824]|nr:hypothetical protein FS837_012517 [Tulasnella sp. UAMH 9824]
MAKGFSDFIYSSSASAFLSPPSPIPTPAAVQPALASTGVFATPVSECVSEICGSMAPVNSGPSPANFAASIAKVETPTRSLPQSDVEQLSNAERFVRGLPPKKPKLAQGSPLRRSQSSPVPCKTYRGIIQVNNKASGAILGYLAKHSVPPYTSPQPNESDAFIVSFKIDPTQDSGSAFGMTIEPDIGGYPDLGLVQGRDNTNSDISPGSFNYLYITGTAQTPPGSTPQDVGNAYFIGAPRTSESVVWIFNSATYQITCQWVNTDGCESPPRAILEMQSADIPALLFCRISPHRVMMAAKPITKLFTQSNAVYAGSDPAAFQGRFPAPVTEITFTFLPRP